MLLRQCPLIQRRLDPTAFVLLFVAPIVLLVSSAARLFQRRRSRKRCSRLSEVVAAAAAVPILAPVQAVVLEVVELDSVERER